MKKGCILLLAVFITACSTYNTGTYNGKTYNFDVPVKTVAEAQAKAQEMYEAEQKAAEEARVKAEEEARQKAAAEKAAREKAEQEKKAKIKSDFDKAYSKLLNSKCSTDKWNSYQFGEYFTSLARRNKITPWQVANGTSYERRNISSFLYSEISDNYIKLLVYHFPDGIYPYFESLPREKQAPIFNEIVKKYNACYQQLK